MDEYNEKQQYIQIPSKKLTCFCSLKEDVNSHRLRRGNVFATAARKIKSPPHLQPRALVNIDFQFGTSENGVSAYILLIISFVPSVEASS
jgi:hypothetical protein